MDIDRAVSNLDLEKMFAINDDEVQQLLLEFPATYGYYAVLAAEATVMRNKAKFDLDVTEADVNRIIREDAKAQGAKITEKAIDSAVKLSAQFREAFDKFNKADENMRVLNAIVAGLDKYGNMLLQASKYQIAEMAKTGNLV